MASETISSQLLIAPTLPLLFQTFPGGCGAQYRVDVCSEQFRGLSTVKQHKLVTSLLKEEVANMHAIRIFTSVPE